ncbi:MAG: eight-cysteine-cluster domain-containing protein [Nanoarchaeota archaeon]|nr:eight-cysteine-cluster domain-containing protein [Nanoarchaeota archaeon]MCG2718072.1 eight-cysteine-cluster domain-containing protein [Nanoarchaeota archaeon]
MKKYLLLIFLIFILGCVQEEINDFESCAKAGNPVMESYPRQCRANDQTFVEELDEPVEVEEPFCGTSIGGKCESDDECVKGGCSSQLCESKNEEPLNTICDYKECYNADKYGLSCKCVENKCQWV